MIILHVFTTAGGINAWCGGRLCAAPHSIIAALYDLPREGRRERGRRERGRREVCYREDKQMKGRRPPHVSLFPASSPRKNIHSFMSVFTFLRERERERERTRRGRRERQFYVLTPTTVMGLAASGTRTQGRRAKANNAMFNIKLNQL